MIPEIEQFLSVLEAQLVLAICFYASVLDVNCRHLSQILGQMVKMTRILKSRLESSLKVGFSEVNFECLILQKKFVKSPKQIGGSTVFWLFLKTSLTQCIVFCFGYIALSIMLKYCLGGFSDNITNSAQLWSGLGLRLTKREMTNVDQNVTINLFSTLTNKPIWSIHPRCG